MWVFIERVGNLYVGVAHDDDGRQLLEISEPLPERELYTQMAALFPGDQLDLDVALYEADKRPNDARTPEYKFFHLLRVRAKAGLASESDAAWVLEQLRDPNSIFGTVGLLWTLGYLGPRYEHVVVPYLSHANTNGEAESAMRALFQMGLLDKYVDVFVEWLRGSAPPERRGARGIFYGMAVHAFRQSQNPKILGALIDASNDVTEKWTTREHARCCLADAIDLENAPIGRRLLADDPYYAGVVEKGETLLAELTSKGQSEP